MCYTTCSCIFFSIFSFLYLFLFFLPFFVFIFLFSHLSVKGLRVEEFESEEYLVPVIPDDPLLQIDWEDEEEEEKNEEWGDTNLKERYKIHVHVPYVAKNVGGSKFLQIAKFLVLASFNLVILWPCAIEDVHDDSKWQIFILANGY